MTTAIEDQVSLVVIAGDLYDGSWKDYSTGIFFAQQMGRLAKASIRAYLYGNHDAESEMTKSLKMPDNVHVFSSHSPEIHKIEDLNVALHGRSFPNRAVDENLAASYREGSTTATTLASCTQAWRATRSTWTPPAVVLAH